VLDKDGNLAAYIDRVLLQGHLFRETWDPEGLLSTIPALATTLLGTLTGQWLRTVYSDTQKVQGLFLGGLVGVLLGQLMNRWFPINKNLWTSSFVVFTGGMALLVLGVCYWLVDIRGIRRPVRPLVLFGANPLTVYVLATLVARLLDLYSVSDSDGALTTLKAILYEKFFASWAGPFPGSLLFAVAYVGLWVAPMLWLYRHKIFLKL
jgi:predicted acyltransferase